MSRWPPVAVIVRAHGVDFVLVPRADALDLKVDSVPLARLRELQKLPRLTGAELEQLRRDSGGAPLSPERLRALAIAKAVLSGEVIDGEADRLEALRNALPRRCGRARRRGPRRVSNTRGKTQKTYGAKALCLR